MIDTKQTGQIVEEDISSAEDLLQLQIEDEGIWDISPGPCGWCSFTCSSTSVVL